MGWLRRKFKAPKEPLEQPPPTLQDSKPQSFQPPTGQSPTPPPSQGDQAQSAQPPVAQPPPLLKEIQPVNTAPMDGLDSTVSGGVPLGLDATGNEELTKIWLQVQEKVSQLARNEGKEVNKGLDVDDVIANLDASQEKKEDSPTRQAVKTAFGRTMGLIKTVGGIVADGASAVFAPAGQCYNVISFLINAYEGYQGAFEGLADLLDSCSAHLGRLDYYVKAKMDAKLSRVAAEQLSLFIDICDAALKLRYSAGHKFKTGMKIAFLQENDIQGLLGKMEKLATKERGLVSAQTFERACAAATSAEEGATFSKRIVDMMVQNGADQKERVETEGQQRTLMDVLAFDKDPDRWDSARQEPVQHWLTRYNEIRNSVVPGTGRWLLEHEAFQSWVADLASSPILGVEGADITGKSYLTSSVVRHLQKEMPTITPDFRHLVAYVFLDREKPGQGFDHTAKSLIWQFSKKDEPYMKSASRVSQTATTLDPDEIIPKLLLGNTEVERMDAVFYLVIDGLSDNMDNALLKFLRLASEPTKKKIRIFLTGTQAAFAQAKRNGVAYRSIPISGNNSNDVQKFIEARMDKFDTLSDTERFGVAERRNKIREDLSEAAAGDYYKINSALDTISTLDYMEEIEKVIQGARQDRSNQIADEVEKLNRERTPRQIREINQIILWISYAIEPISVEQLAAVLYMNIGEAPMQPLPERFRTKYLLFEVNSRGRVGFRSSRALNAIPQRRQLKAPDQQSGQEIQPGEVNMIRHFLDKVCPPDVYKKLEIDTYLQQKLKQKQDQVQQEDHDTGHLLLALNCLRALSKSREPSIAALQEYARKHLTKHLSSVDLAMVDREQKSLVGELLVRVLTVDEYIDAFMWPEQGDVVSCHQPRENWVTDSQDIDQVLRWFKDTAVVSSVTEESDRNWIKEVVTHSTFEGLLKRSVARLAYHCFREPSSAREVNGIYYFTNRFLSKIRINQEIEDHTNVSIECITRFEQWAHDMLQLTDKDTLWHTQMALVYKETWHPDEAIKLCDVALKMEPKNWRASLCKAKLISPNEAIEILRTTISRQESDSSWMQITSHTKSLAEMNYELAEAYWKVENYDLAISTYAVSLKQDPRRTDRSMNVLLRYEAKKLWTTIVAFIEHLATVDNKEHIADLVSRNALWPSLHRVINNTAVATQQSSFVDLVYETTIQMAEKRADCKLLFLARYYYGATLNAQPNRREDKVIQLWEHALNDHPLPVLYVGLPVIFAGLGGLYLQRALVAKTNEDPHSVADYLRKISDMVPEEVTQSQLLLPPQLYLARFYHVSGNDAKAREIVRTLVQVALELLSDEDAKNDSQAFGKLLFVFIPLGDKKNVAAALALAALSSSSDDSDDSDDSDNGEEPEIDIGIPCHGQCKHLWKVPSEMWICMNCISVMLEENCLKKLREGKLEHNICHRDHEFLEVPKWDEERMALMMSKGEVPWEMVPWGDQNITLDEWVQEIRKEYIGLDA
ncbi:unnamed protein product [Penicillium nalgiovense]|nr:unnamed protein product [Penicillium nalgiovense]